MAVCGCGCICGTHRSCDDSCECPCHTLDKDTTEAIARSLLKVLSVQKCIEFAKGSRERLFVALRDNDKLYDAAFESFVKRNPEYKPTEEPTPKPKSKLIRKPIRKKTKFKKADS